MEEYMDSIIMAVRCPCCDTLLFESDDTNTKHKCPTCKRNLMITINKGQLLINVSGEDNENNYAGLVKRQRMYFAKVSKYKKKA